jgi:hypothetical protein
MEATPQAWMGKSLLSPHERALRKVYKEKIRSMILESKKILEDAKKTRKTALELEKVGRNLLPRIQLSRYTVGVFLRKLAAARNKEGLLNYISMDTIKSALTGTSEKCTGVPSSDMETILANIKERQREPIHLLDDSLELVVENELKKERLRRSKNNHVVVPMSFVDASLNSKLLVQKTRTAVKSSEIDSPIMDDLFSSSAGNFRRKKTLTVDAPRILSKTNFARPKPLMAKSSSTSRLPSTTGSIAGKQSNGLQGFPNRNQMLPSPMQMTDDI